jgi:uncharacterized protein YhfF
MPKKEPKLISANKSGGFLGCTPPDPSELEAFWGSARDALPAAMLGDAYQVRWIGLDDDSTRQILELIRAGDKTGTYTLPWIVENTGQPTPAIGDTIILVDFGGHPQLIVRLTEIETVPFGQISETHTAVDGPPMRDLAIWKPLHTRYWNGLLEPYGLTVSDEMPVWVEKFDLLAA